jgi:hypothetical protein
MFRPPNEIRFIDLTCIAYSWEITFWCILGVWLLMDCASCPYNSFQGEQYCCTATNYVLLIMKLACHVVCNSIHLYLLITGVHFQSEGLCQFPTFVALCTRCLLHVSFGWYSYCSCAYRIVSEWHICEHLSIYSHYMGNFICEFSESPFSFFF